MSSPIERAYGVHNPAILAPEALLEEFVARREMLAEVLNIVRSNRRGESLQHLLFVGPRGMGKTMMVLAIAHSIDRDADLSREWIPVLFPEEAYYGVADLADFWLEAQRLLLDKLGRDEDPIDFVSECPPEELENRARQTLLDTLDRTGKRAILFVENLSDVLGALSDPSQEHALRAFLMDESRVMLVGTATSYFAGVTDVDRAFFDFFRTFRLSRFGREETFETLRRLARLHGDEVVPRLLEQAPERIDSLRVLTGGNPRLIKVIYRMLREGAYNDVRTDLDRLLDDCTPYFKHRIESLSGEQRRVFDRVARHWDPVRVRDLEAALRRPSNKISIYLRRLVDEGFLEEAADSTDKRRSYQVAERFYNIYYLMRFSRTGRRRLEWLARSMQVLYTPEDYRQWVQRTLEDWRSQPPGRIREQQAELLQTLTSAPEDLSLRRELTEQVASASWTADQLSSLGELIDRPDARTHLGKAFTILEFLASLDREQKARIGYAPASAAWWHGLTDTLEAHGMWEEAEAAYRKAIELDPNHAYPWNGLGNLLQIHLQRFDDAEAAYKRAIELDPNDTYPWNGLGNLLQIHLQRFDDAEAAYKKAIELDPNYASPWNNLGNLLQDHLQRFDDAEAAYVHAIELGARSKGGANLARLLQKARRDSAARRAAADAVMADPRDGFVRSVFLDVCQGSPDSWLEVLPLCLEALEITESDLLEFVVRGLVHLVAEQHVTARQAIELVDTSGASEPLADLVLALRALDERDALDRVAPERRVAAEEFMSRLSPTSRADASGRS